MDLEILEALALSPDRQAAFSQLLPGSEDHDYYRCLAALHANALQDADQILQAWTERHGHTHRYTVLKLRYDLHRLASDPAQQEQIRDHLGVSHWHEPEVATVDPTRPTAIAPGAFDAQAILTYAHDYDTNLSQVTDDGLQELLARSLDTSRRRALLSRLTYHADSARLVAAIAEDLEAKGSNGFGSLTIHDLLTQVELEELARLRPKLRGDATWTGAIIRRLRPHARVDLELDRDARAEYLAALWMFVGQLPASANSLKAHVLWHALDTARRRGAVDHALVDAYLALPRHAHYTGRAFAKTKHEDLAHPGQDFRATTGLPPAGDDEELVRALIQRFLPEVERWEKYFDRAWLDAEIATAKLLRGDPDADRSTLVLGPARAAELRERVEIQWVAHAPTQFAEAEAVTLDVDVKNVAELVVKVFRVDPLAYYQHAKREVSTDLDLDGLAATHEETLRFTEPPVRRVRRSIALPICARPGTYIVDLIGNGKSSRVVIYKGRLRHVARIGAAGHVVTIVDEAGAPRPDARAWIGDREYVPDAKGAFVVPFSTAPSRVAMLLAAKDVATVQHLDLQRETYALEPNFVVDRSAIVAGRTARVLLRLELRCSGQPASLELLERATWDVTLTDRTGVATTKAQPLALVDGREAVLEVAVGEDTAHVALSVRGSVRVISEQRDQELIAHLEFPVATIDQTVATEALYLANTAGGWVLSALGKTGEPRAQRPLTVSITHRYSRLQHNYELATDANGRVELGPLPGAVRIAATLGQTQTWNLEALPVQQTMSVPPGRELLVPLPTTRTAEDALARLWLVELRAGVPMRSALPDVELEPLASAIAIRKLTPGDYLLRSPSHDVRLVVTDPGTEHGHAVVTPFEIVDTVRSAPAIAAIESTEGLVVRVRGGSARTRVHVIATRFVPALAQHLTRFTRQPQARRADRTRGALYLAGRELGDEYRYILERKHAKRHPSLLLERPSLLLNPWARRTTTTDVQTAGAGDSYQRMEMRSMASPSMPKPIAQPSGGDDAYLGYAFLPDAPAVLENVELDATGVARIARAALGRATTVTIVVDDPAGSAIRRVTLPEGPLAPRDLRLALALDPAEHATQAKKIVPLRTGETLVIDDLATAKVHLIDSVEKAHAYLLALGDNATLREFAFVTRWHLLSDAERREQYSKYACHELHLFLACKDRPFFDAVVRPHLAHKRVKTFLDHYLLGDELTRFLEPVELVRLNAVERALLAQRMADHPALARLLADEVALIPPDPSRDTRLIDALLGAASLDGDETIASAQAEATRQAMTASAAMPMMDAPMAGFGYGGGGMSPLGPPPAASGPTSRSARAPMMKERAKKKAAKRDVDEEMEDASEAIASDDDAYGGDFDDGIVADRRAREEQKPMFRAADKTQELAENNYWHLTPQDSRAELVAANRLWRDLAALAAGASFLSPWLGLATSNFTEAMCALAVTDLPFVAARHAITSEGPRLAIVAAGNALAGTSQLALRLLEPSGPPLVVGQNFVRTDDRYDYATGEQVDKYIDGAFAVGVVYTCQIVLANPSSSRQRIAALVQIPRGSLAVAGAKQTTTIDVVLEPYGTHGHEYAFYIPAPGDYPHFPVHVSREGTVVAAAPARALHVVAGGDAPDPKSWAYISQRGTLAEVVAYLASANLAATDLSRIAWRLRAKDVYLAIVAALEQRHYFAPDVWGYALLHGDAPRIRVLVRVNGERLLAAGPIVEAFDLDAEMFGVYEHLEYAPLINARAHRLGGKLKLLNDGFAAQYRRFLERIAHRSIPTSEDLLAAAAYYLVMDRYADTLATLARVQPDQIADRMQHDYLAAYAACLGGDLARARSLASPWRDLPVDRWRRRFEALLNMLDEVAGTKATPEVVDPKSRDQQHAELAAKQPAFEIAVDRDGVVVTSQNVDGLELRYFEMDIELLFSRQPFVASDVSRFSFIEPGHRERLATPGAEHRVPWASALRGKNVVVEGVGAGLRRAKVHYANDLTTNLAHQYGQVRVQRASDRGALPATYVKVYARKRGGAVSFYKDGYTDLRGWFDYASLSTTDLDDVERFAILVSSDASGSTILEASPPAR